MFRFPFYVCSHPCSLVSVRGSKTKFRRGFTLIELLIVIAIISILAALLMPVFATARENARRASCASNLKSIGLAVAQYTQDYDEMYPLAIAGQPGPGTYTTQTDPALPGQKFLVSDGAVSGHWVTWMDMLQPYIRNTQIFACPDTHIKITASYGYNSALSGWRRGSYGGGASWQPMALSEVKRPAETVLALDYNSGYSIYANGFEYGLWSSSPQPVLWPHLDGGNICYADGHVKWVKRLEAATTSGGWSNRAWNAYLD